MNILYQLLPDLARPNTEIVNGAGAWANGCYQPLSAPYQWPLSKDIRIKGNHWPADAASYLHAGVGLDSLNEFQWHIIHDEQSIPNDKSTIDRCRH